MNYIYFDSAATTRPSEEVIAAFNDAAVNSYANPASMHSFGLDVEKRVESARTGIASTLNANAGEIVFTSSGTEANNLAVFGTAGTVNIKKKGGKIITTDSEHDSVYQPIKKLEQEGFEVVYLPTKGGAVNTEILRKNLDEKVILVSVMLVNNETGAIYDIKSIIAEIEKSGLKPYIHCDAVQAYGKLPIDLKSLNIDLLTVSAHKIHGLKGMGALYIKNGRRIVPQIIGGGHENGLRASTLNTAGIIAFAKAAEEANKNLEANKKYIENLYDYAVKKFQEINLNAGMDLIKFNQPNQNNSGDISKNILSISVQNVRSEIMLNFLAEHGICVSSGSACSEKKKSGTEAKRVLLNYGLDRYSADFSLRISFSRYNTTDEINELTARIAEGTERFRVLM